MVSSQMGPRYEVFDQVKWDSNLRDLVEMNGTQIIIDTHVRELHHVVGAME